MTDPTGYEAAVAPRDRIGSLEVVVAAVFAAVASLVVFSWHVIQRFESRIAGPIHVERQPFGTVVDKAANWSVYAIAASALAGVVFLLTRKRWLDLAVLLIGLATGFAIVDLLQRMMRGDRPADVDSLSLRFIWQNPSGHAFGATLLATLGWVIASDRTSRPRRHFRAGLVIMVAAVSSLRLLNGEHYLGDVVSGVLAGCAWSAICLAMRKAAGRFGEEVTANCS